MAEPILDIFSGQWDSAIWLDAVEGLSNARLRMEEIAAQDPGQYFVFSTLSHSILARVDTSPKSESFQKSKGSTA